jgi:hypothetical protein
MNNVTINGITVYTKRVEFIQGNQMTTITPPTSTKKQDAGKKDTLLVDLFRITERFTVDGFIESGDWEDFLQIVVTKGNKELVYRGITFLGGVEKTSIVEDPEDKDDQTNSPAHFDVKFTFVVGKGHGT